MQDYLAVKGLITIQTNQNQQLLNNKTQKPGNKPKLATKKVSIK